MRWMAALVVVACGAPPPAPPPIANAATPTAAGPCDLGWIETAGEVRIAEHTNGHEGYFDLELRLQRSGDAFTGAADGHYRAREAAPPIRGRREVSIPIARVVDVPHAIAASAAIPEPEQGADKRVLLHDTWHTVVLALEVRGASGQARLSTAEGHQHPQTWRLSGCERKLSHEGRRGIERAYGELEKLYGRQPLFDELEKQATP